MQTTDPAPKPPVVDELMSGAEYLDSLRDTRAVYLYGERVDDVTTHTGFRNSARSIARLYDALRDPAARDLMTTVDRQGIRTHRFFAPSYSAEELLAARDAIAAWARLTYGFMGRTPDYKAAFMATLGANPEFYAPYDNNARQWYRRYASKALFLNHVLINPPVDRMKPVHEIKDVFLHVVRETDAGAIVSGAKMLATGSALTNATFVAQNSATHLEAGKAEDFALVFIAPMDTPGTRLLCRLACNGTDTFRGVQAALGDVVAWRTLLWAMTTALAADPQPGPGGSLVPRIEYAATMRIFATSAWPAVKSIIENVLGGAPLVTPSGREDLLDAELRPLIDRYYRGTGATALQRIKLFKLLWDAIGSEFGGRHELYERNYAGNHEQIRVDAVSFARRAGALDQCLKLVDQCLADYDLDGWVDETWL